MAQTTEQFSVERLRREMRALKATLAGSCTSALRQIESRPTWSTNEEFRTLWAQFTQARSSLLEMPEPETLPPKIRPPKRKKLEDIDWEELLGEQ